MSRREIPKRDPAGYPFTGSLLQFEDHHFLAFQTQPESKLMHSGDCIVRYGFRYLGKPHLSIVPGIVALDYGDMLTGQDAWEFVQKKSNLHPRADIVGYRHDGLDEMISLKMLDLAIPPAVLVYENDQATISLASVEALITTEDELVSNPIPPNLLDYIPRYDTLNDWQNAS